MIDQIAEDPKAPKLSQDAAVVLVLAETAVPFAAGPEDEAERWLRVLRLHGKVGVVLQALGVGESPLETIAQPKEMRGHRREPGEDIVEKVANRAVSFARGRGSDTISTVDILFGVLDIYSEAFDRALYVRGTTRDELLHRLAAGERAGERAAAASV